MLLRQGAAFGASVALKIRVVFVARDFRQFSVVNMGNYLAISRANSTYGGMRFSQRFSPFFK